MDTTVVATYETYWWPEICAYCGVEIDASTIEAGTGLITCPSCGRRGMPECQEDPKEERGFCAPHNPWGDRGRDTSALHGPEWKAERAAYVQTVTPWEAAEMVASFPGGVWDYDDSGEAEQDIRTGRWTSVTLHVDRHEPTVFALADLIKEGKVR